jgi:acetylglutamate kinase
MKEKLNIIKIGGNVIDDENALQLFLYQFSQLEGRNILIHGGGKIATRLAEDLGIKQTMVDGRRITDKDTLNIVTMTYAGLINKNIIARLQSFGCNAIGLSGADGNVIRSKKRGGAEIDYGFVGDVEAVNAKLIKGFIDLNLSLVFCAITHDKNGLLLNTNADTIAQEIASALSSSYEVSLIYSFEKEGVLLDVNDNASVINTLDRKYYSELKAAEKIFAGMIPKLDNAFKSIESGVAKVIIGNADNLKALINSTKGTTIV